MKISSQEKLLLDVVKILDGLKIEYLITGGFAISVWGRPRATFDIDIVVKIIEPQSVQLSKALQKLSAAGYIEESTIKDAIRHKGEFNFIDGNSGLKVDFWVAKEKSLLGMLEFKNRKLKKIRGQRVFFISPEDLIISKLQWYQQTESTRHLEDIESVFKLSGKKLDGNYLKKMTERLGFSEILEKLDKNKDK